MAVRLERTQRFRIGKGVGISVSDRSNYLWKATLATATVASVGLVNISGVLAQTPQASATSEATHTEEIEDVPAPAEELDPLPGTSTDPAAVENVETIEEPSTEPTPASEPPALEETNVPTSEPTPEVTPDAGFPEPSVAPEPSPTSDSEPTNEPQPSENTEPSEVPAEVSPVPQPSAVPEPSPTAELQPSESPLPDPAPTAEPTSSPTPHNTEEPTPHPSIPESFPVEPKNHLPEEEVTVAPSPDNESAIDHAAAETETTEQPTDSESVEEVPNTSAPTTQPSTTENQFSGSRPSIPAVNPTSSDGRQTGVLAPSEQQPPSAAHGSSSVAFEQPAPQTTTAQQHTVPPRTQRGWSTLSAVAYPQAQPENRNSSEPLLARATRPDTHGTKSNPGSSSLIASGTGLFGVNREKGEPNLVAPIQQQPAEWVQGLFSTTAQDSHGPKDSVAAGVTGANNQEHSAGTPTTSEALTRGEKIIQGNAPAIFFTLLGLGTIVYVTRQFTRSQKG